MEERFLGCVSNTNYEIIASQKRSGKKGNTFPLLICLLANYLNWLISKRMKTQLVVDLKEGMDGFHITYLYFTDSTQLLSFSIKQNSNYIYLCVFVDKMLANYNAPPHTHTHSKGSCCPS